MSFTRNLMLVWSFLCFGIVLLPIQGWAEEPSETEKESAVSAWRLEPMVGAGGLFSRGASNPVLLTDVRFSYVFEDFWRLGFMHSSRSLPWRKDRSFFHIPGVESEIRPLSWLGCGVGVGPALATLKSGKSREFATGFGWTLHVSTEWLPTRHVGIGAKIFLQQMLVRRSLYSAVGGVAGDRC